MGWCFDAAHKTTHASGESSRRVLVQTLLTGLGLHFAPNRVITKPAINLIVFHRDLPHGVDVVPVVIRRLKVGVIADLLLVGIGAQLQDVHASVVLKSCEGLVRLAPK